MKNLWIGALTALIVLSACQGGKKPVDATSDPDSLAADTTLTDHVENDSTIYGTSDEFGMSTFTLISDKGDTLYVTRTANDGTDGKIYGDLKEGERYALTTRDNNKAIGVLINLSQLERHTKDYRISNGKLILKGDTVTIEKLSNKELKVK